jgi:hypothetical protein
MPCGTACDHGPLQDQDPNFPAMMTFRHARVGTSSLNRVAATSRLLLPLAAGTL